MMIEESSIHQITNLLPKKLITVKTWVQNYFKFLLKALIKYKKSQFLYVFIDIIF